MPTTGCPPAVESTAYHVVAEAVTNAVKHAQATKIEVDVVRVGDRLRVEVADDGIGGARVGGGAGLRGIADRVGALGGTAVLDSADRPGDATGPGGAVRVVIGEDEALLREGLVLVLRARGDRGRRQRRGRRRASSTWSHRHRPDLRRSPTSGCPRPTPTTGCARRCASARRGAGDRGRRAVPARPAPLRRASCSASARRGVGYLLKQRIADVVGLLPTTSAASPPAAPCSIPRWSAR